LDYLGCWNFEIVWHRAGVFTGYETCDEKNDE